jgi:hypothetical protein
MNFAQLQTEVRSVVRDPTVETSIPVWINQVIGELAFQWDIPVLRLRTPATLTTTTATWLYNLSACTHPSSYVYHKKVFRVASEEVEQGFLIESPMTLLDDADFTHNDTGDSVQRVAIEGSQIGVYPLAADSLSLWFYRQPVAMSADADSPDGIDADFHYRLIVPMVVIRAMRLYPDYAFEAPAANTSALQWWTQRLNAGLYGDGFQQGWVHTLRKERPPRVQGAALGGQVSGGGFFTRRGFR